MGIGEVIKFLNDSFVSWVYQANSQSHALLAKEQTSYASLPETWQNLNANITWHRDSFHGLDSFFGKYLHFP